MDHHVAEAAPVSCREAQRSGLKGYPTREVVGKLFQDSSNLLTVVDAVPFAACERLENGLKWAGKSAAGHEVTRSMQSCISNRWMALEVMP